MNPMTDDTPGDIAREVKKALADLYADDHPEVVQAMDRWREEPIKVSRRYRRRGTTPPEAA